MQGVVAILRFGLYLVRVTAKHKRIAELTEQFSGTAVDPRYGGYFALFNQSEFYAAHDVLEDLWLADRLGANGNFYKGLIQLAGAFIHLQKNRLRPSAALFKLAQANLLRYSAHHEYLNLESVVAMIRHWLGDLEREQFRVNPLASNRPPCLQMEGQSHESTG